MVLVDGAAFERAMAKVVELEEERHDLIQRILKCEQRSMAFERRALKAEERLATQAELRRAGLL